MRTIAATSEPDSMVSKMTENIYEEDYDNDFLFVLTKN